MNGKLSAKNIIIIKKDVKSSRYTNLFNHPYRIAGKSLSLHYDKPYAFPCFIWINHVKNRHLK